MPALPVPLPPAGEGTAPRPACELIAVWVEGRARSLPEVAVLDFQKPGWLGGLTSWLDGSSLRSFVVSRLPSSPLLPSLGPPRLTGGPGRGCGGWGEMASHLSQSLELRPWCCNPSWSPENPVAGRTHCTNLTQPRTFLRPARDYPGCGLENCICSVLAKIPGLRGRLAPDECHRGHQPHGTLPLLIPPPQVFCPSLECLYLGAWPGPCPLLALFLPELCTDRFQPCSSPALSPSSRSRQPVLPRHLPADPPQALQFL